MLRHRPRSRRRRLLGPLGIGVLVFVGIAAIVAGNGASPPPTVGAVAGEVHVVDVASPSPRPSQDASSAGVVEPAGPPAPAPTAAAAAAGLTGYRWPIAHPRITLPFGASPWGEWFVDGQRFHDGIDMATFCGDRIVAAHDGTVLAAGRHFDDFLGWVGDLTPYYTRLDAKKLWTTLPIVVVIDDGNGYRSVYAHFGKIVVKTGQSIHAGDLLGYEGRTGHATGCHLHYGLFSPSETASYTMDPAIVKRMKVPTAEIARVDPETVLPPRPRPAPKPTAKASPSPAP
ncbi:MAG TPA: M23 family metallopeptidase [Candidatus Limnocylindrales bacterium]|nr:M23 family metallopeptidase [Candidatus Limnocylindrales bacterium]